MHQQILFWRTASKQELEEGITIILHSIMSVTTKDASRVGRSYDMTMMVQMLYYQANAQHVVQQCVGLQVKLKLLALKQNYYKSWSVRKKALHTCIF